MRVVLASEVDTTKLVGAPSREVKRGGGSGSGCAGDVDVDGVGAIFGTRCNDEHAANDSATTAKRNEGRFGSVYRTALRMDMTLQSR